MCLAVFYNAQPRVPIYHDFVLILITHLPARTILPVWLLLIEPR